ncbi:hypothetical protein TNCV_3768611 [Trichonephila clavipes]|nr:hypothetical protein TNCV_3768611 [Trichonephila clavipes]
MRSLVYASPIDSDEALVARIAVVAGYIRKMPRVFANVRQSLRRRVVCIFAGGHFFEQFFVITQASHCLGRLRIPFANDAIDHGTSSKLQRLHHRRSEIVDHQAIAITFPTHY